jgi:hypothetical protein
MAEIEIMFSGRSHDLHASLASIFGATDRSAELKASVPGGHVTLKREAEPSASPEGNFTLVFVPGSDDAFSETIRWLKEYRKKYRRVTLKVTRSIFVPPEYVQMIEEINNEGRLI